MIRRPWLLAALVATLAAAIALAQGTPAVVLETAGGAVDVIRAGTPLVIYPGLTLASGDVVHTRDGRAVVRFADGSEIKVRPHTRLVVTEEPQQREVEVLFGRLWAYVARKKDRPTNFRTGGTLAAIRGTQLEWAADLKGGVDVGAVDDTLTIEVTLASGAKKSFELRPGQRVRVSAEGLAGFPVPFVEGEIAGAAGTRVELPSGPAAPIRLNRVVTVAGNNPLSPVDPVARQAPPPGATPAPPGPTPIPCIVGGPVTATVEADAIIGCSGGTQIKITVNNQSCETVLVDALSFQETPLGCQSPPGSTCSQQPRSDSFAWIAEVPGGTSAVIIDFGQDLCCVNIVCPAPLRFRYQTTWSVSTNIGTIPAGTVRFEHVLDNCPECMPSMGASPSEARVLPEGRAPWTERTAGRPVARGGGRVVGRTEAGPQGR